jgi:putative endonuclease
MFYVYVIKSGVDGRLYKGHTQDVYKRLEEHNSGKTQSTASYRPWTLVLIEEVKTKAEAIKREKFLKSGSGREYIKNKLAP